MPVAPVDPILLRNFAIALFIGALVGVDREHRAARTPMFGGLRTFMLIALVGAVAVWLSEVTDQRWLPVGGLLGIGALLVVATRWGEGQGITSEVAALVVYLLGGACVAGYPELAVVLGIATSALLTFKTPLHEFAGKIAPDDLAAGLKLLFATFIVLPLLPNAPVDPFGALNPYRLWWLVVLISSLSLLGYVAVRWLGHQRGLALTGIFGGLVSSTAVTLSAARQSRIAGAATPDALAMSVLLAWAVMFVRVIVEVAVVHPPLLAQLAPAILSMGLAALVAAGWFARGGSGTGLAEVPLRNPFSLWEAMKFALGFALVMLVVALGQRYLDPRALYGVAALAGTTDVDAITLSMAEQAKSALDARTATVAIAIATVSNTFVKAGMVAAAGSRPLAIRIAIATACISVVGLVVAVVTA